MNLSSGASHAEGPGDEVVIPVPSRKEDLRTDKNPLKPSVTKVWLRLPNSTLVPEVFFRREETRQERERSGERKPLVAGDANLTIMLR